MNRGILGQSPAKAKAQAIARTCARTIVGLALLLTFAFANPTVACANTGGSNVVDPTQRADNSFIYDTTVASLFSSASLYNNRTVQVIGEVIGDCISSQDPNVKWITLTETNADDKSSISVLMPVSQTNQIVYYGRYGVIGTTLQVRGIYHMACEQHDGLPDVHVTNSSAISPGRNNPDTFDSQEFAPGIMAMFIGVALYCIFCYCRERTR